MGALESDGTQVEVVRVFTDATGRFGNPLGIARAADVVDVDHQALAARARYSETVVVEQPVQDTARMRIYTPPSSCRSPGIRPSGPRGGCRNRARR